MNRLEADYREQIEVISLNAGEEGAEWFRQLGLPGHPSYVLFMPDGQEVYRTFGIVEYETLQAAVESQLDSE